MVVVRVFYGLLFEGISSILPLVPQTVPSTLIVLLSTILFLKACDGHTLFFTFLCFNLIKALIFPSYTFSIFIVIIKMALPPFEFVFGLPNLGLGELEIPLAISLSR